MTIPTSAGPAFSTSTDPVAASLRSSLRSADARFASRPDAPPVSRGAGGLDLAALYPDLYASASPAPAVAAVRSAARLIGELARAFRLAPAPHR